jgi:hypothetical protein
MYTIRIHQASGKPARKGTMGDIEEYLVIGRNGKPLSTFGAVDG